MGKHWISERKMRSGHGIGGTRGMIFKDMPLRKISYAINVSMDMFTPDWVMLECGHTATAWGMKRARCKKCRDNKPQDEVVLPNYL